VLGLRGVIIDRLREKRAAAAAGAEREKDREAHSNQKLATDRRDWLLSECIRLSLKQ